MWNTHFNVRKQTNQRLKRHSTLTHKLIFFFAFLFGFPFCLFQSSYTSKAFDCTIISKRHVLSKLNQFCTKQWKILLKTTSFEELGIASGWCGAGSTSEYTKTDSWIRLQFRKFHSRVQITWDSVWDTWTYYKFSQFINLIKIEVVVFAEWHPAHSISVYVTSALRSEAAIY